MDYKESIKRFSLLLELESSELPKVFYHGSSDKLSVGTILTPRMDDYEKEWMHTDFYKPLEKYRPSNMLSHKESVFSVGDEDDVDLAGGATDWLFTVKPLGEKIEKHDLNWSSEICGLVGDGQDINSPNVKKAALNYWNGVPHYNEQVWEYLSRRAEILSVEEY